MLSFMRGSNPPRRQSASQAKIFYEDGKSWQEFFPAGSEYACRHSIPPGSFFQPPPHLHLFQSERFRAVAGVGVWHQPGHPDPAARRTVMRAGDPPNFLPAGLAHHFENASADETLVVDIGLDPESPAHEVEARFFRNFFGYLDDCRVHGSAPSLFQLELFLWSADTPLAIPVPGPNWLKYYVSRAVTFVLGPCIGGALLGYKTTYPEYYNGPAR